MADADIVVIGSGLGGLQVALTMAMEGKRVLVLERQHQPGGCMQSFCRGKLEFETGLHCVGGLGEGEALHEAFAYFGLMDLPWQQLDMECSAEIHLGGQTFVCPQGIRNFIDAMKVYFPDEERGLDMFSELLQGTEDAWMQGTNAWECLNSMFGNPMLVQVLSAFVGFRMELCRETLSVFTLVQTMVPFVQSSWRLKSSGNDLLHRLTTQINSLGGEVLTDKEVVLLKEEDGRVTEAVCADGSSYSASWFVSNVHPEVTCRLLDDGAVVKRLFRRRISAQSNTCGMFTLHIQLRSRSLHYFNHNKIVVPNADCWDMAVGKNLEVKGIMISARVPEKGEYVLCINIMTPMKWEVVAEFEGSKSLRRPKAYKDMKKEVERRCIELAETIFPGLSKKVLKTWSSTPLTYMDRNRTPEGSAFGMRKSSRDCMKSILSPRTPIPNLLMTGQHLMLHGVYGVTMTSAYTCQEID